MIIIWRAGATDPRKPLSKYLDAYKETYRLNQIATILLCYKGTPKATKMSFTQWPRIFWSENLSGSVTPGCKGLHGQCHLCSVRGLPDLLFPNFSLYCIYEPKLLSQFWFHFNKSQQTFLHSDKHSNPFEVYRILSYKYIIRISVFSWFSLNVKYLCENFLYFSLKKMLKALLPNHF